ncbi:DUF1416 domain-containing protein [Pseudoduganella flava]|uniref:DUF1416 domain-containing protein n=1 Tax=Pseudoduganella flava TaxID=871742 RepID=A0ABX6FZZ4_9BURK|nr:DUF1416 domain-containing protein [Pseudoduganella flava]
MATGLQRPVHDVPAGRRRRQRRPGDAGAARRRRSRQRRSDRHRSRLRSRHARCGRADEGRIRLPRRRRRQRLPIRHRDDAAGRRHHHVERRPSVRRHGSRGGRHRSGPPQLRAGRRIRRACRNGLPRTRQRRHDRHRRAGHQRDNELPDVQGACPCSHPCSAPTDPGSGQPPATGGGDTGTGGSLPPSTGAPQLARIGDTVWEDANGNGIQDRGEAGIGGVTVVLRDSTGATVQTTTTDASGHYQFEAGSGTYTIGVTAPAGYTMTAKGAGSDAAADSDVNANGISDTFTVAKGDVNDSADAGMYRAAGISTTLWNDANGNGQRDAGEAGIASVKAALLDAAGNTVATSVTDAQGNLSFAGLQPGSYSLKFDAASLPAGYTFRATGTDLDAAGASAKLTLASGQQATLQAAAFAPIGTVASTVWEDRNGNGVQDAGETGIAGTKVRLVDTKGVIVATTTTDAQGNYKFSAAAGDYTVRVDKPAGFQFTSTNAGANDAIDSDVDASGASALFTVRGGQTVDAADAGAYRTATLGNRVWFDCDGDGIQDSGESGIGGVKVTLLDKDGKAVAATATDCNGQYAFTGLKPGTYSVQFDKSALPSGYVITQRDAGTDDTRDSDIDANGLSQKVVLLSGETNNTIDAGVAQAARIHSTVWEDSDYDGLQDCGEAGIGGVTVRLYDANHVLKASTVTAADGSYEFGKLAAGSYSVEVVRPSGYYTTKANVGYNSYDSYDSDFSNVGTTTTATSGTFKLAAGEVATSIDAGLYRKASIGDKVWRDANHNGVQDTGEEGIGKIKVMLYNAGTGALLGTTTTDAKGSYLFKDLDPGSYYLKFDKTNVSFTDAKGYTYAMNDWKWGVKNTGSNDQIDSDVKGDGISKVGLTQTDATFLSSGENDMSWDAAITPIALDLDGDGIHTIARADFTGKFDLLGTGNAIRTGWLSSGDAFLAIDANGNGTIDGIGELFGGASKGSGFAKLASFDSNGDGHVDAHDAQFGALTLWRDANSNGITDAGELISLAQAGVTSLAVAFEELPFLDANGNLHLERSSATVAGHTVAMTDVYFNVAAADVAAAGMEVTSMATLIGQAAQ